MDVNKFFSKVEERYFCNFNALATFDPSEVDNKKTISQFRNDQSIKVSLVGEGEMSITDEAGSSRPVTCSTQIVTIDEL